MRADEFERKGVVCKIVQQGIEPVAGKPGACSRDAVALQDCESSHRLSARARPWSS